MVRRRMLGVLLVKGSTLAMIGVAMVALMVGNTGCAIFISAPPPPPGPPPPLGPLAPSTGPTAPTTSSTGPAAPTTSSTSAATLPTGRITKWTTSTVEGEAYDPTATGAIEYVTLFPLNSAAPSSLPAGLNQPVTVVASRSDVAGITQQGHGFRFSNGPKGSTGDTFNVGDTVQVVVASDTTSTDGNLIHNRPAGRSQSIGTPTLVADGTATVTSTTTPTSGTGR